MKLPDYLLWNKSHRGEALVDLIVGTAILGIIMASLFNVLLGILGQSAQTSKMIQANWVANSYMEEVMGFSFDDVDDFDSDTYNEYGLEVAISVEGAVVDGGAGTISIPLSPPVDPDYKQVQVTVSGGGLNENIVLKTLVANEEAFGWIAGKIRNFSPQVFPRRVGNAGGTTTPHGIVGARIVVNGTDPLLETFSLPDNPDTQDIDESGMFFIDNVPLGDQIITVTAGNVYYDPQYPKEPVQIRTGVTILTYGGHLPGRALGRNRMDFIGQPLQPGGVNEQRQDKSVTVTERELPGDNATEKIENLLRVQATGWDLGDVFGTIAGDVTMEDLLPSYGGGLQPLWMEDFRFVEGVSINWNFHENAVDWLVGTTEYTQAEWQLNNALTPWSIVNDPWGYPAVKVNFEDDGRCGSDSFTWQQMIDNDNCTLCFRKGNMLTMVPKGWPGPVAPGGDRPVASHTISHGGRLNSGDQYSEATAAISLITPHHYRLRWTGIGEAEYGGGFNYDNLSFEIDNVRIATASSSGGGHGCDFMNLVDITFPGWNNSYLASVNSDGTGGWEEGYFEVRSQTPLAAGPHSLKLTADSGDHLYHYGSFFQVTIQFQPVSLPFFLSTLHATTDGGGHYLEVIFSEPIWTTRGTPPNAPTGRLQTGDFNLVITAGTATVGNGGTPTNVTQDGINPNKYRIDFTFAGIPSSGQVLTLNPVLNQIYDYNWGAALPNQGANNSIVFP